MKNKFMVVMLAIALAVSMLFTSSIVLSTIHVEETMDRSLRVLDKHTVLGFINSINKSPVDVVADVHEILTNTSEVKELGSIILAAKYVAVKEIEIPVPEYNTSVIIPNNTVILVMTADKTSGEWRSTAYFSDNIIAFNVERDNRTGKIFYGETSLGKLFNKPVILAMYKEFYGSPVNILYKNYLHGGTYIPFELLFQIHRGVENFVFLCLTPSDLRSLWSTLQNYVKPLPGLFISESDFYNLNLDPSEIDELIEAFRTARDKGFMVVFVGVKYDLGKVVYGYSISASIRRVSEVIYSIGRKAISKGYAVYVGSNELASTLSNMGFLEQFTHFITIIAMVPSFIIILIISSRLPPVIISVLRKVIALIRIRGVGIGGVKRAFTVSVVVWSILGLVAGALIGPMYALVLKNKPLLEAPRYIGAIAQDVYTLAGLGVVSVIAVLLSIRKSFSLLASIAPREFTRPTILAELPLIEKGMGKGSWIILVLGIYYVVKTAIGFSPITYIASNPPQSPILVILFIILIIIEPIIMFFGPVFFIYGVARAIVAYPDKMAKLVNSIVSPLVGELKNLVSRLLEVKPARITVAIMLIGFSVGILLNGVIGSYVTESMMDTIRDVAYGTDYYVYKHFNTTYFLQHESEIIANATRLVGGDYSIMAIIGVNIGGLYLGEQMIAYMLFIDENSFTRVFRIPDGLGVGARARDLIAGLGPGKVLYVAGPDYDRLEPGEYTLVYKKSRWGSGEDLVRVMVTGDLYNLPGCIILDKLSRIVSPVPVYSFEREIQVAPGAFIPIPSIRPFLVMDISDLSVVVSKLNNTVVKTSRESGARVLIVVASNSIVDEKAIEGSGWSVVETTDDKGGVENAKELLMMGVRQDVSVGLALYTASLIAIAVLAHSSIYENLYAFTLLRARGVKSSSVMKAALAEGLAISLLGIIPGIILGVILGYGSTRSFFSLTGLPALQNIYRVYGIGFMIKPTLDILLPTITTPLLIILLSLIVSYVTYKKVLREALVVLGSHM